MPKNLKEALAESHPGYPEWKKMAGGSVEPGMPWGEEQRLEAGEIGHDMPLVNETDDMAMLMGQLAMGVPGAVSAMGQTKAMMQSLPRFGMPKGSMAALLDEAPIVDMQAGGKAAAGSLAPHQESTVSRVFQKATSPLDVAKDVTKSAAAPDPSDSSSVNRVFEPGGPLGRRQQIAGEPTNKGGKLASALKSHGSEEAAEPSHAGIQGLLEEMGESPVMSKDIWPLDPIPSADSLALSRLGPGPLRSEFLPQGSPTRMMQDMVPGDWSMNPQTMMEGLDPEDVAAFLRRQSMPPETWKALAEMEAMTPGPGGAGGKFILPR